MSQKTKNELLARLRPRYQRAGKGHKQKILDEFCATHQYDRKYAIKLLNRRDSSFPEKRGRKPDYGEAEKEVLEVIWRRSDYPCGKRLKAILPLWLAFYPNHHGEIAPEVLRKLNRISAASIDRLLAPSRAIVRRRRHGGTRPGSLLKTQIPIRSGPWETDRPGYMEADTVAHCGGSMSGSFIWSITYTDIHTEWTETRAVWNRGAHDVVEQTREMEAELPFELLGFDCDNGSEFLNHHLVRYFSKRKKPVPFTRSRPYHKDDNAHVEQKNWTHVRQLLGYDRFEKPELVELLNDLYRNEWRLLQNFFSPSMKLVSKERIGGRYRRYHDKPQTPWQRLRAGKGLKQRTRQQLNTLYKTLDPFELTEVIEKKLRRIFEENARAPAGPADRYTPPSGPSGSLRSPPGPEGEERVKNPKRKVS